MSKAPLFIAGGLAALLLLGLLFLSWGANDARLDASALGVEGFVQLAPNLGVKLEQPKTISPRKASEFSLRVLPLYDLDFSAEDQLPRNLAEQLGQITLREMEGWVFYEKLYNLDSLVVLPKWRGGVVVTGVAHSGFLIPPANFAPLLDGLELGKIKIQQGKAGFQTAEVGLGTNRSKISLFHPQTFQRDSLPAICAELLGLPEGALLIRCPAGDEVPKVTLLSDPDLLNTHGITLGRNADLMAAIVKSLQLPNEARPIYLDTSSDLLLAPEADEEAQHYERDADTLLRLFAWPLSLLWLAGGAVLAVTAWRGAMRFGPVQHKSDDRLEVSKVAAIDAMARLIRLSHNDHRMTAEFVHKRLHSLAVHYFGATVGETGIEKLFAKFARHNADDAAALRAQAEVLQDTSVTLLDNDLRRLLDQFKVLLERLTDGSS